MSPTRVTTAHPVRSRQRREHNARAAKELRAIFELAFARKAVKSVQNMAFEDLQLALQQAERSAIAAEHKRIAVRIARCGHRGPAGGGPCVTDDDESGDELGGPLLPSLADLPAEVVESIFEHLDPIQLGRCACVNSPLWRCIMI
ncbi:hypothetical protein GPECTOR_35g925 [Gonium pectorale]|uniref:F-box domain-containing protein n=1 Tax=Gonium pectorale TaxID=33097 RepID=A0A150GCB2_GONPE|nr:hypothetical protein GPECTOR_35g925 [Gonium pectorale]|eukprot:KXZ47487.1 hypothetical protein GPECTOR_35g925 [Gonium pectorale]